MHLGISAEPAEAVGICRAKLAGDDLYEHVDLLSLGFFAREDVPRELPSLLDLAGIDVTIHPVELNIITDPAPSVVAMLDAWVTALDPLWLEQDGAVWLWRQQAYLASQIVTPPFSDSAARRLAETTRALTLRWDRPFLVENPPVFAKAGDLTFYGFLDRVRAHGGQLTLDIGHAIGAQINTGEPVAAPSGDWTGWDAVKSVHLSGQQVLTTGRGRVWMDSHGSEFSAQQLRYAAQVLQRAPTVRALTLEMEGASRDVVHRNLAHAHTLLGRAAVHAS